MNTCQLLNHEEINFTLRKTLTLSVSPKSSFCGFTFILASKMFVVRVLSGRFRLKLIIVFGILLTTILVHKHYPRLPVTPFTQAKLHLKEEDDPSQVSRLCSQKYGGALIESWKRTRLDVCSGSKHSSLSCFANNEYLDEPRLICVGQNTEIHVSEAASKNASIGGIMSVDCSLEVYHWLSKRVWPAGPMTNPSRLDNLECANFINHTVFWLNRYDVRNKFHVLEDAVTTLQTLLVLDLDPADIELVIWDNSPTNNTLFQMWSFIFGRGVRVLRQNPFNPGTCFRRSIFSMFGGISLLSHDAS